METSDETIKIKLVPRKGSDPKTIRDLMFRFANEHDLHVSGDYLIGKSRDIERALRVNFYREGGYRQYRGTVTLPSYLDHFILTVFGLSDEPAFERPSTLDSENKKHDSIKGEGFTPIEISKLYNFPKNGGKGQRIGIIELGGGYFPNIIRCYLQRLGVPSLPMIKDTSIEGASNNPYDKKYTAEVYLDLELIASIAYEATINIYFCPNSCSGFLEAITRSIEDQNHAVSISWGSDEKKYSSDAIQAFEDVFSTASSRGTVFYVSSGDNGAINDRKKGVLSVGYPASSPHVVGVGGTSLSNGFERGWDRGGGGFSSFFRAPSYQNDCSLYFKRLLPKCNEMDSITSQLRGVPDCSLNSDPRTGYLIKTAIGEITVGGTSAAAPLLAAFTALINTTWGKNITNMHTYLYDQKNEGIRPIPTGYNGGYFASNQWNPCTGVGVVEGERFLDYLRRYH